MTWFLKLDEHIFGLEAGMMLTVQERRPPRAGSLVVLTRGGLHHVFKAIDGDAFTVMTEDPDGYLQRVAIDDISGVVTGATYLLEAA